MPASFPYRRGWVGFLPLLFIMFLPFSNTLLIAFSLPCSIFAPIVLQSSCYPGPNPVSCGPVFYVWCPVSCILCGPFVPALTSDPDSCPSFLLHHWSNLQFGLST
ncbi:hypothetical protein FKM82_006009 [Ascaphus truei]